MLTEHKKLEGMMPKAWHEDVWRANPSGDLDAASHEIVPKARLVVDETDTVLATVSNRHTLVQNRDFISALDVAASRLGLTVEPIRADYRNGKARYSFQIPELTMQVDRDPSKTSAKLDLRNDHGGTGGLGVESGYWRWRCVNGLIVGSISHAATMRHTGEIDVLGFVSAALEKVADEFAVHELIAQRLPHTPHHFIGVDRPREDVLKRVAEPDVFTPTLVDEILADTAKRYDEYLRQVMLDNRQEMGDNLWALAQAVSQTSTHRMPGQNADAWATRQLNRIRQVAGVR